MGSQARYVVGYVEGRAVCSAEVFLHARSPGSLQASQDGEPVYWRLWFTIAGQFSEYSIS